jgi:hypothetical protein
MIRVDSEFDAPQIKTVFRRVGFESDKRELATVVHFQGIMYEVQSSDISCQCDGESDHLRPSNFI